MSYRFLIVDDSDLVRRGLRNVLQQNPEWEVSGEASNGTDAVEAFKKLRPDVVIVDFQMPGMNGIEAARRMLEIMPAVPIFLFTQHASAELEKRALEAGIQSVISKSDTFPMVSLIEALLASGDFPPAAEESLGGAHHRPAKSC
jgi:DNA-binding NarL/FixJ family response regulator